MTCCLWLCWPQSLSPCPWWWWSVTSRHVTSQELLAGLWNTVEHVSLQFQGVNALPGHHETLFLAQRGLRIPGAESRHPSGPAGGAVFSLLFAAHCRHRSVTCLEREKKPQWVGPAPAWGCGHLIRLHWSQSITLCFSF